MKALLIMLVVILGWSISAALDISGICSIPSVHYLMGYLGGLLVAILAEVL